MHVFFSVRAVAPRELERRGQREELFVYIPLEMVTDVNRQLIQKPFRNEKKLHKNISFGVC